MDSIIKQDFSKAEKGDSVYCLIWGSGVVENVVKRTPFPLDILFEDGEVRCYSFDGRYFSNSNPTLFHAKPEIIAPPKPKKKVTKYHKKWYNVYAHYVSDDYPSREAADHEQCADRLNCVAVDFPYEVEE